MRLSVLLTALLIATPALAEAPATRPTTLPAVPAGNPKTLTDLRAIEARVKEVVKKSIPATVAVLIDTSQGSGVIVSPDGTVLTAGHVAIESGKTVTLVLADGRRVRGKSLGINESVDSGMIKITDPAPPNGWPVVPMGKAADLKAGQWTVALGHPGGYRRDRPPVARLGRVVGAKSTWVGTDNPLINGDSGGPLFDLDGNLIGIHSRIGPTTAANIHVPIDSYTETWDRLAAGETWGKGFLGHGAGGPVVLGLTAVEDDKGVKVAKVVPDSPAAKAGIKPGDFITKFAARDVKTPEELVQLLARRRPGEVVRIEVLREDASLVLNARLAPRSL